MGTVSPYMLMICYSVIQSAEDFSHVEEGTNNIGRWVKGNYLILVDISLLWYGTKVEQLKILS